jgi:hypothetical protein
MPVVAAGTPVGAQVAGDCRRTQCDGAGHVVVDAVDDTDVPVDGAQCTADVCTGGVPSNPPLAAGAACSQSGGNVCDGGGLCVDCNTVGLCPTAPPTVRVVRVGDGTTALSGAATAGFIDERRLDGSLIASIPLPTAPSGNNLPLVFSGSATSDGGISLSADGRYVVVPGYATVPGTAGVAGTATATVNRVVARIDALGNVDTSSAFTTAFNQNNVRGAASADGTGFWAAGAGGGTAGIWFVPLGVRGGTQVNGSNTRWPQIFGGQLYGTASNNPLFSVFTVGTGLPTTAGQTVSVLPGLPASAASPFGFVLFDRTPDVAGMDTLYIADDRSAANGGGVQKWTFNGALWTQAATFNVATTPIGFRGLTAALVTATAVTLVATTADSSTNRLVLLVDDGVTTTPGQVIATAAPNTIFRGVALSPHN